MRGENHDWRLARRLALAHQSSGLDAVETWHAPIEQHDGELMLGAQIERFRAGMRAQDPDRQAIQDCFERDQIRLVVVDDQYRWTLERHFVVSQVSRGRGNSALESH